MKNAKVKKYFLIITIAILSIMLLPLNGCGKAELKDNLDTQAKETALYITEKVESPNISSVGGEWAVKGVAESGAEIDEDYFEVYFDNVRAQVKATSGQIHENYYSDYARVVIGLSSIGKDSRNVEGYDLTAGLDKYEEITRQGANAVAYTLVAANTADIELIHENDYVNFLLSEINLLISEAKAEDVDYISMAILGLSFYQDRTEINKTVQKAVETLSLIQQENGTMGNCESTAEAIIALSQLGVDVFTDNRFVKEDNNLGNSLMEYYVGNGGFSHSAGDKEDLMATEKALLAIDSMRKLENGERLY